MQSTNMFECHFTLTEISRQFFLKIDSSFKIVSLPTKVYTILCVEVTFL